MDSPASGVKWRPRIDAALRVALGMVGVGSLGLLVALAGWEYTEAAHPWLERAARATLAFFGLVQFARLALAEERLRWMRRRWFALLLAVLALAEAARFDLLVAWAEGAFPGLPGNTAVLALLAATQVPVLLDLGLQFIRLQELFAVRRVSPGLVLMVSFGVLVIAGTLLLKVPRATTDGITWPDALFTSTSAVCVTGLIVVDTETAFTPTGHMILLVLIQVGGLGVMTLTTFLAQIFGGVSLRGRVLLQDLLSEDNLGRITRTLPIILVFTFAIEALGAVGLYHAMGPGAEARGGQVFSAVFHSVSAFCNAGFSTWSSGLYDPLVRGNSAVQVIVMVLVVAGGLSVPVLWATIVWAGGWAARVQQPRRRRPRLSVHARLAWLATAVLIVGGALVVGLAEYGVGDQPHDTPVVVSALFHSITARTAGFNITPVEAMTPGAVSMLVLLMFIGGCPGSTAGGVKATAFFVALLNVRRILSGRREVELFGRRLPEETVSRALAILFLSLAWIGCATTLLALLEPGMPLADLVFETVSAISTVGLSRGVTAELGPAARMVIVITMFAGRIGVLYFVFAFLRRREVAPFRLPEENINVT